MTATRSDNDDLQQGLSALKAGNIKTAERRFKAVLRAQPRQLAALNLLGIVLMRLGRFVEAEIYLRQALQENANSDVTLYNYGVVLKSLNRLTEALEQFTRALKINPTVAETWNNRGVVFNQLERHREAITDFDRAIALNAAYAEAFYNKANALAAIRMFQQSLAAYDRALALRPDLADAWLGRGNVLFEVKKYDNALAAFDKASALKPNLAGAWLGRGNLLASIDRYDEAFAAYDKALASDPNLAEAWLGRGNIYMQIEQYDSACAAFDKALALKSDLARAWLGRGNISIHAKQYEDALSAYDKALASEPGLAEAWLGRGNIFTDLKQYRNALCAYDQALVLDSDLAEAWFGRGIIHSALKRYDDAGTALDRAIALKPDFARAWLARGAVYEALQQYGDACAAYEKAIALKPDLVGAAAARLNAKLYLCDWANIEGEIAELLAMIKASKSYCAPGILLALPSSASDQQECAKRYVQELAGFPQIWRSKAYSHDRIRIAYLSADFREHAVAYLMAGLFEHHDKSLFQTTAISFGPRHDSPMRDRIKSSVENFVDVYDQSESDIADLIRRLEIDLAIDLMGLTWGHRLGILARRPAPIQVNYLGYAGTTGASFIDYILSDHTVIPEDQCRYYAEQVVWLPDSFMVNDDQRAISERVPSRAECGLPEDAFVFCCFNSPYKFAPQTFRVWMRLLSAVPGSVLWLSKAKSTAEDNLRREAEAFGVPAQRLIFAPRLAATADHLARHRQADLFLDTLPYNAHATACDALWAGLPVLTCLGSTFAGRVAASLLKAIGLGELITHSLAEYEALALKLARESSYLASIKDRLARNRNTFPLFNTARTTRQIEGAYTMMWERYRRGEAPKPSSGEAHPIRLA